MRAILLEGEAGVGKTTLWEQAVERAGASGFRVLATRAGQSEARLTFVGLVDLLAGVDEVVFGGLPVPQRAVLDVALMRAEAGRRAPEQRLVSVAFFGVLRELAGDGPVAVACDDVQWLDTPSYAVLEFALRRLGAEPVLFVATRRLGAVGAPRTLGDPRVQRIRVGPLSLSAIHRVLVEQLGHSFPRPVLARIEHVSGGNPFFAVELGRAIIESGETVTGSGLLPVPADLRALIGRRVVRLPKRTRMELVCAAALSQPRAGLLDLDVLAPGEREQLVRIDARRRVAFTHPLYAAAVYSSATASERRAAHRRLAELAEDLEERARHLALAADGADAEVAAMLEDASARAAARGAPGAAAELAELALEATPPADRVTALRRTIALADALFHAGDGIRSRRLLEEALDDAPAGRLRCEALSLLARVLWHSSDWRQAIPRCEEALAETTDGDLAARLHAQMASMGDENITGAAAHARAALELMHEGEDPIAYGFALLNALQWEFFAGQRLDRAALEHGLRLIADATPAEAGAMAARWARSIDELGEARGRYERFIELASELGDEPNLCIGLAQLATLECWLGDLAMADEHARRSLDVAEQTQQQTERGVALHAFATVAAHRGEIDVAREATERMLAGLQAEPDPTFELMVEAVIGFLDCSLEAYASAAQHLGHASALLAAMGFREPAPFRFQGDEVDAALGLGELERARQLTAALEQRARVNPIPWTLATAARCRGLVRAAAGDLAGAEQELEAALVEHERLAMPLELARTLLALGQVQRRRKEKLRAKETLDRALEICERIAARVWAERVRRELARVGLRRGDRDALTASEERVAALAVAGLTNREIAERAFMSPKTVEAHLARAYRKLGIRSRAELGRVMAERGTPAQT